MKYENFWFKHLECPNYQSIREELSQWVKPRLELFREHDKQSFEYFSSKAVSEILMTNTALAQWFDELKVGSLCKVGLVSLDPFKNSPIHTDFGSSLAINVGIHVKNTQTNMLRVVSGEPYEKPFGSRGNIYMSYDRCELEQVNSLSLEEQPALFNTQQLHQVLNPTANERVAISFRFNTQPEHLI